jgi:hypothetical protein
MVRPAIVVLTALSLFHTAVARAETPAREAPPHVYSPSTKPYAVPFSPPSGSLPRHPGAHAHEGFYLRAALGPGLFLFDRSAETSAPNSAPDFTDSRVSGLSIVAEMSIGGTPLPGLVVAGTFLSQNHPAPTLELDDGRTRDLGRGNLTFVLTGGTVDYYPRPSQGLHVGGTLGVAYVSAPSSSAFGQIGGLGFGIAGLAGKEFWLSDVWSIGPILRITMAYVMADNAVNRLTGSEDSLFLSASLSAGVTYH